MGENGVKSIFPFIECLKFHLKHLQKMDVSLFFSFLFSGRGGWHGYRPLTMLLGLIVLK